MFNWGKIEELNDEVDNLKRRIESRDIQIKHLEEKLAQVQAEKVDAIKADVNDSEFVIDWKNMDVFSIERMGDHNAAYTVLGHWIEENGQKVIHEWKFYCSHEQHQKLAKEFKNAPTKQSNSTVRKRSRRRA